MSPMWQRAGGPARTMTDASEMPGKSRSTTLADRVPQPGRALGSGPRGRWFKSTRPDHFSEAKHSILDVASRLLRCRVVRC